MNANDVLRDNVKRKGLSINVVSNNKGSIVDSALETRHILDKQQWLNGNVVLTKKSDYLNFIGKEYVDEFIHDWLLGTSVGILADVDADGYMSSAMFFNYINDNIKNDKSSIEMLVPNKKLHGIAANVDLLKDKDINWLILPDSSSNDTDEILKLYNEKHVKSLVIDHHDIEQENIILNDDRLKIISNQFKSTSQNLNSELTGAGMVYVVLQYLDHKLKINNANHYLDLAAIGQIGDMSDLSNFEIHNIVQKGLKSFNNPLLKYFYSNDKEPRSIKHMQFTVIPQINSVSRIGTLTDRYMLVNSLIKNDSESYKATERKKGIDGKFHKREVVLNIYQKTIKLLKSTKGKQDRLVKKAVSNIKIISSYDNTFNFAIMSSEYNAGLTGLVANKLLGKTKKMSIVVQEDGKLLRGSMRSPMKYNAKAKLAGVQGIVSCLGHPQAAGIVINNTDVRNIIKNIDVEFDDNVNYTYDVDKVYFNNVPSFKEIKETYDKSCLFSGTQDEPKIASMGITYEPRNSNIKNHLLKFVVNGLEFIQYNADDEILNKLQSGFQDKTIDCVGTVDINNWTGRPKAQFIIEDIALSEQIKVPKQFGFNNIDF